MTLELSLGFADGAGARDNLVGDREPFVGILWPPDRPAQPHERVQEGLRITEVSRHLHRLTSEGLAPFPVARAAKCAGQSRKDANAPRTGPVTHGVQSVLEQWNHAPIVNS